MKKFLSAFLICLFAIMSFGISLAEPLLPEFICEAFEISGQPAPTENTCSGLIQYPKLSVTVDGVEFSLAEALYDGRTLFTVFIARSDASLSPEYSGASQAGGKRVSIAFLDDDAAHGMHIERFNDDGSLTLYSSQVYTNRSSDRDFTLRFKVRTDGSDELFGENAMFSLSSGVEWSEQVLADNASLGGATVKALHGRCILESYLEILLQLPNDLTESQAEDFSQSFIKVSDAETGEELSSLNGVLKLLDSEGSPSSTPVPGGSIVVQLDLPTDCELYDTLKIELVRAFGDGSIADKCEITVQ